MKRRHACMLAAGLAAVVLTATGCRLMMLGAGVAVGAGAISYYENELYAARDVTLERAWNASQAAMQELGYSTIAAETHKDATGGVVQGRSATDQVVNIRLTRQTDNTTEIRVRVGTFATQADRSAATLLYEKMSKHF